MYCTYASDGAATITPFIACAMFRIVRNGYESINVSYRYKAFAPPAPDVDTARAVVVLPVAVVLTVTSVFDVSVFPWMSQLLSRQHRQSVVKLTMQPFHNRIRFSLIFISDYLIVNR